MLCRASTDLGQRVSAALAKVWLKHEQRDEVGRPVWLDGEATAWRTRCLVDAPVRLQQLVGSGCQESSEGAGRLGLAEKFGDWLKRQCEEFASFGRWDVRFGASLIKECTGLVGV